jgi:hypothetical protein
MSEASQRTADRRLLRFGLGVASLTLFVAIGCRSFDLGFNNPRIDPRGDLSTVPQSAKAPTNFNKRIAPYVFFSDFDLEKEKGLLDDLAQLRDRVSRQLQLPVSSSVVQVYLFEDQERYTSYLEEKNKGVPQSQKLPSSRRALFVATKRIGARNDLLVYTYRTERLGQDLRHELTHALLHSVLLDVPLWLDEGLAEYFELPPERNGVNAEHVRLLLHDTGGPARPDLGRLETLKEVQQMQPAEYREAWAWVHLMLHGKPEARKVLLGYLTLLKETKTPPALGTRLVEVYPQLAEAVQQHLVELDRELAQTPPRR